VEEADVQRLVVAAGIGIAVDDGRDLPGRADHHGRVEAELFGDGPFERGPQLVGSQLALEDDVAALDVGGDVLAADRGAGIAQRRHGDLRLAAHVDAAQQRYVHHAPHATRRVV
jgi:hypothetical protein